LIELFYGILGIGDKGASKEIGLYSAEA